MTVRTAGKAGTMRPEHHDASRGSYRQALTHSRLLPAGTFTAPATVPDCYSAGWIPS